MEWELKVTMVGYINSNDDESLIKFLNENINNMDLQAWDMLITGCDVDSKVWEVIKDYIPFDDDNFGFQTSFRLELIKQILESNNKS